MVQLSASPNLDPNALSLFHATEPILSDAPIILFRGPASSVAAPTISSSRIQCHIFSPAGFQSYSRLAISPSSPLYAAVSCLSREDQGDEVCRELAYSLYKYFSELPRDIKDAWLQNCSNVKKGHAAVELFSEAHAANIASRMRQVEDTQAIINDVTSALASKGISYIDTDVILPSGSVSEPTGNQGSPEWEEDASPSSYGKYADLIQLLGNPVFLPTSKMRRAPSRPMALNHSLKFTKSQKEALRREMCEMVDTEESYIAKLQDLVHNVAPAFRRVQIPSSKEGILESLFPRELDDIVRVNSVFFAAVRDVFDNTESAALDDLNQDDMHKGQSHFAPSSSDAIGALDFAKCLLDNFPKFKKAYGAYIKAHERMAQTVKLMFQTHFELAAKVQEVGEKRLMSLLIEPVQRLPRYSLYIENMTKQLPIKHPALKYLLQAKDLIADVCAQEPTGASHSKTLVRLKQLVKAWPTYCNPKTRLITSIDLIELQPPYNVDEQPKENSAFIGLLFADALVLIHKPSGCEKTARGLFAEVENSTSRGAADSFQDDENSLSFSDWIALSDFKITEMNEGQSLQMSPVHTRIPRHPARISLENLIRIFYVSGVYEGRVARFTKEVIKARIEGRFSEKERENSKWQVRELESSNDRLGLINAIFEADKSTRDPDRGRPAQTRIIVDPEKHKARPKIGEDGVDVVASLTVAGNGFYRLEIDSAFAQKTKDFLTGGELVAVITKRLCVVAQLRRSARNPLLTSYLLQHYEAILRSLRFTPDRLGRSPSRTKSLRQHSPVKAIANFFGGSSKSQHEPSNATTAAQIFGAPSKSQLGPKSVSEPIVENISASPTKSTATVVANGPEVSAVDISEHLETALETYVLALRSRKGNIVGRVIANRSSAPEAAVNQLYNALLEQPQKHESAAQASVDALFAGFEKFLKVAWRDTMGPVLDEGALNELQYKSSALAPIEFEEYLAKSIEDMVPQNRRALRGIIGLLIDLLDGTTNDSDRGSLMATITEIVICEGNPHDYMSLFDRLVEEHDVVLNGASHSLTPEGGSTQMRSSHHTSGSLSSKASSWSKRLGFGSLGRKNSKAETSVGSRTPASSTRGILDRTKSVDWSKSASPLSRPGSSDRPVMTEIPKNDSRPGTGRSWDRVEPLESLKESTPAMPRKKRRSSLSDLDALPSVNTSPFWNTPSNRRPENSPLVHRVGASPLGQDASSILSRPRPRLHQELNPLSSQHTSTQSSFLGGAAQSGVATVTPLASPTRSNAVRHRPPTKKENMPPSVTSAELSPPSSGTLSRAQSSPTRRPRTPPLLSGPRGPLTERVDCGNTPPPSSSLGSHRDNLDRDGSPVKKLQSRPRTQTGQTSQQAAAKLPDRIQDQRSAITQAEAGLMAELAKIGAEMAAAPSTPSRANTRRQDNLGGGGTGTTPRKENFEGRLKALETKVPHLFRNLAERTRLLEEEMAAQLKEKDDKIKDLEGMLAR